jgi:hypothetical protein
VISRERAVDCHFVIVQLWLVYDINTTYRQQTQLAVTQLPWDLQYAAKGLKKDTVEMDFSPLTSNRSRLRKFLIQFLSSEPKLRKAKRCKILLALEQARQVGDDIFFKRSRGRHFGRQ